MMEEIKAIVIYGQEDELDERDYFYGNALIVRVANDFTRRANYSPTYAVRDLCTRKEQLFSVDVGPDLRQEILRIF